MDADAEELVAEGELLALRLVIRRRFAAGLRNLEHAYKAAVDTWAVYDNAGEEPILLEWSEKR